MSGRREVEGLDSKELQEHLWNDHKIFTAAIRHPDFRGLRISPSVYTLPSELDRFCDVIEKAIRDGLPT